MVAVADPRESWSAARFTQEADACVQSILARNKLPILAGGTGLYLDALISGRTFAPGSAGGAVRAVVEAAGIKDIRAKSLRSNNPNNVVAAAFQGLKEMRGPEEVARIRGKSVEEIVG